jgi:hypothetical protein
MKFVMRATYRVYINNLQHQQHKIRQVYYKNIIEFQAFKELT